MKFNAVVSNEQGFTLIELLVSMSVFLILILLVVGAFSFSGFAAQRASNLTQAEQSARLAADLFRDDMKLCRIDLESEVVVQTNKDSIQISAFDCVRSDTGERITWDSNSVVGELHRLTPGNPTPSDVTRVHAADVEVESVRFFLRPPGMTSGPADIYFATMAVSFVGAERSTDVESGERGEIAVQVSVASRLYEGDGFSPYVN